MKNQWRNSGLVLLTVAVVALVMAGCGGGGGTGSGRAGIAVTRVGATQGLGGTFGASHPSLSQTGRYLAFQSDFSNLVTGDNNNVSDIFLFDKQTTTTTRVSVAVGTNPNADDASDTPVVLASTDPLMDGRYVAFNSHAGNLVVPVDNARHQISDVYIRDTRGTTPSTSRVSVGVTGNLGDNSSFISGNGIAVDNTVVRGNLLVAFYSNARNLFPALDNNGKSHVYLRDVTGIATFAVDKDNTGLVQADGDSLDPSVSANGRFVVYTSYATNIVPGDTNAKADIFVFDRTTGKNLLMSVDNNGVQGNGDSTLASISATGRFVVFTSAATNLVSNDNNGKLDVFLHDRDVSNSGVFDNAANTSTIRISVATGGAQGNGDSNLSIIPFLSISADGRSVVYETLATNFDPFGTAANITNIFLYDRVSATTRRLSVNAAGQEPNNLSADPVISPDGKWGAYSSFASNLVGGDTNGLSDVFFFPLQ